MHSTFDLSIFVRLYMQCYRSDQPQPGMDVPSQAFSDITMGDDSVVPIHQDSPSRSWIELLDQVSNEKVPIVEPGLSDGA